MLTVTILLSLCAFIIAILSAIAPPRAPLWIAVLLLSIIHLLGVIPK